MASFWQDKKNAGIRIDFVESNILLTNLIRMIEMVKVLVLRIAVVKYYLQRKEIVKSMKEIVQIRNITQLTILMRIVSVWN